MGGRMKTRLVRKDYLRRCFVMGVPAGQQRSFNTPESGTTLMVDSAHYWFTLTFRGDKPDPCSILYSSIFSF